MQPRPEHGNRAAVAVVGGIGDELIVERDPPERNRESVIGLDDLFGAGMRQLPSPTRMPSPPSLKNASCIGRNAVDDAGQSERVVRPSPLLAFQRQAGRDGAVDVGEFVGFDIAVRYPARTKAPRSDVISCSKFMLTPPRLRYWRTAAISAGPPVICANAIASS